MKKIVNVFLWSLAALVTMLVVGISVTIGWRPLIGPRARPLTTRRFEPTPERLARGTYLVKHVTPCMECHAPHRWAEHDAPIEANLLGAGQEILMKGLPGRVVAPNLSSDPETGAGNWTDDQLARAIREGIGHDGRALFPMMPYQRFRSMSDEDVASIVVYLRSLPPVHRQQPATEIAVPVRYLIRSVPEPLRAPVAAPDLSTPAKRGAYLMTLGACGECHTPQDDHGQPIPGMEFAGGFVFEGPWGRVASANLTPDPKTSAVGRWDEEVFVARFRAGELIPGTPMPWGAFSKMTDDDVRSVYRYLRSLPAVEHETGPGIQQR